MSNLRKKKYSKNSNKIQKHKIMKSQKRGGGMLSLFGLNRKKDAIPEENLFSINNMDPVDDNITNQQAQENAKRAQQEAEAEAFKAQERAGEEALQEAISRLNYLRKNVSLAMTGSDFQYKGKKSLEEFIEYGKTLTFERKSDAKKRMNLNISEASSLRQEKQERLLETLTTAIQTKKKFLNNHQKSCNTLRPPSKSNYVTNILNTIPSISNNRDNRDTRIKELEDENTKLNGCLKLIELTQEEKDSIEQFNKEQHKTKVEIIKNNFIIERFTIDLRLLKQIRGVYDEYNHIQDYPSYSPSSSFSPSFSSKVANSIASEMWDKRLDQDLHGGGSKKNRTSKRHIKRRTKRHTQYKKRRHTKKKINLVKKLHYIK